MTAVLTLLACQDVRSNTPAPRAAEEEAPQKAAKPTEVSLEEAAALHKKGAGFFDANSERFRKKNGVVPGATLLASSARYDVASTLPADKDAPLVFYCSNRH